MTAGKNQSDQDLLFDVELLTVQQVAKWARVSTKSIYRWIESGKIPVVKFGKRTYRIPARAVIAQLKAAGYDPLVIDNHQG
jgi:excisionase family DNA binding protein